MTDEAVNCPVCGKEIRLALVVDRVQCPWCQQELCHDELKVMSEPPTRPPPPPIVAEVVERPIAPSSSTHQTPQVINDDDHAPKSEGTAMILEILLGLFGIFGIGHIWAGDVAKGLSYMLTFWVYTLGLLYAGVA